MNSSPRLFPVLAIKHVDERAFIEFWSSRYPTTNEVVYQAHIGKPLTKERLLALFKWKNNGPQSLVRNSGPYSETTLHENLSRPHQRITTA
jgi:hypothetical protein